MGGDNKRKMTIELEKIDNRIDPRFPIRWGLSGKGFHVGRCVGTIEEAIDDICRELKSEARFIQF